MKGREPLAILGIWTPHFSFATEAELLGRNFGNFYVTASLLGAGFEACHLYARSQAHKVQLESAIAQLSAFQAIPCRVFLELELSDNLSLYDYGLFQLAGVSDGFAELCFLREKHNAHFRLLATIHSISYSHFETDLLRVFMAPTRKSDLLNCASQAGLQNLLNLFAQVKARYGLSGPLNLSLAVLPFGIDTNHFRPGSRPLAQQKLGLPEDRSYLLSLARFSIEDKFDYGPLIQAYKTALPHLQGRWTLVLAGGAHDPSYLDTLKRLVSQCGLSEDVVFLPNLPDALKVDLYTACDVFVSPSDNVQETFGLTAIEAMACGLPVVVSDWDGYKDTVAHGVSGLRIPTYMPSLKRLLSNRLLFDNSLTHLLTAQAVVVDMAMLAASFILLGTQSALRKTMGAQAREQAVAHYDTTMIGKRIKALLIADFEAPVLPNLPSELTPFELFSHYPTRALEPGDRLQATDFGRAAHDQQAPVFLCREMEGFIELGLTRDIVRFCEISPPIQEIHTRFEAQARDGERLLYTLYWLLKQGFLQLVS
jgi:D-inositol-3-phosphate glycosyltransferase